MTIGLPRCENKHCCNHYHNRLELIASGDMLVVIGDVPYKGHTLATYILQTNIILVSFDALLFFQHKHKTSIKKNKRSKKNIKDQKMLNIKHQLKE